MKIGIITFHNGSNYGAALQAFALQEALKEHYEDVKIINYQNKFVMKGLERIRVGLSIHYIYYAICDICAYRMNGIKICNFKNFFDKYYYMTNPVTKEELKNGVISVDLLISGSDQIWNPMLNNEVDEIYFGYFPGVRRKISYAASLGAYKLNNEEFNSKIFQYLNDYEKISLREKNIKLSNLTGLKIDEMCDPTLLLNANQWVDKLSLLKTDRKYLLIYALCDFENIINIADVIAKEKGLSIVYLGQLPCRRKNIQTIEDAGPKEFVELFYNTSFVITNSFHGTTFSVIFNKEFFSIIHPKSPERVSNFLELVGLSDRLVKKLPSDNEFDLDVYRYSKINEKIESIRNIAMNYLKDN